MNETQAASSPAEVDVFNGQQPTLAEFNKYRETGELDERFKSVEQADSATADSPEQTVVEPSDESEDAKEAQEPPQKKLTPYELRIKQLLAKQRELESKLEVAAKPTQSDSSTAQAPRAPQNFTEWLDTFDVDKWEEDYAKANPTASFAKMQLAQKLYVDGAKDHFKGIETRVNAAKQALDAKVTEAKNRYEDFDQIKSLVVSKFVSDKNTPLIPPNVYDVIDSSDVLVDLLYTLGSDESELDKFVAMAQANPTKAIRYITRVESLIAEQLAKPKTTTARGEDGKFTSAPEKPKTSAPKPPAPVGGGSSRAFDTSDDSLSPEDWFRKRNKQLGIG